MASETPSRPVTGRAPNVLSLIMSGKSVAVKALTRPPRANYSDTDMGPPEFVLPGIDRRRYVRTDFVLNNARGQKLACSHWEPANPPAGIPRGAPLELPCVVYCHGNSSCRAAAMEILPLVLLEGASCLAFDFAGCGQSEGDWVTLGWREVDDVHTVVAHLRSRGRGSLNTSFSSSSRTGVPGRTTGRIALYGRSMGAVAAMFAAASDPTIACVALDSPFADLSALIEDLVRAGRRQAGCFSALVPQCAVAGFVSRVRTAVLERTGGLDIATLRPLDAAAKAYQPAIFAAGDRDFFVRASHARACVNAWRGEKSFVLLAACDHNTPRPPNWHTALSEFFRKSLLAGGDGGMRSELRRSAQSLSSALPSPSVREVMRLDGASSRALALSASARNAAAQVNGSPIHAATAAAAIAAAAAGAGGSIPSSRSPVQSAFSPSGASASGAVPPPAGILGALELRTPLVPAGSGTARSFLRPLRTPPSNLSTSKGSELISPVTTPATSVGGGGGETASPDASRGTVVVDDASSLDSAHRNNHVPPSPLILGTLGSSRGVISPTPPKHPKVVTAGAPNPHGSALPVTTPLPTHGSGADVSVSGVDVEMLATSTPPTHLADSVGGSSNTLASSNASSPRSPGALGSSGGAQHPPLHPTGSPSRRGSTGVSNWLASSLRAALSPTPRNQQQSGRFVPTPPPPRSMSKRESKREQMLASFVTSPETSQLLESSGIIAVAPLPSDDEGIEGAHFEYGGEGVEEGGEEGEGITEEERQERLAFGSAAAAHTATDAAASDATAAAAVQLSATNGPVYSM